MTHSAFPRLGFAFVLVIVLWQVTSCCCCLGGAATPTMTPAPISEEQAQQLRDRINQAGLEQGPFAIEVTDEELTSYVVGILQSGAGEFPARDMQIRFGDGYADIWATFIDIAPVDLPAYVRATLSAVDGRLVFSIVEANAGSFPIPGAMRQSIAQVLSDSLAELELGLQVESVQIVPGKLLLTGQVTGSVPSVP
jgi:hypothetical protein